MQGMASPKVLDVEDDPHDEADEEYLPSKSSDEDDPDYDQDQNVVNIREDTMYPNPPNVVDHKYLAPLYGGITRDRCSSSLRAILGNPRPDTIPSERPVRIIVSLILLDL